VGLLLLAGLLQQALQLLLGEDYGIVFDHRLAGLLLVAGCAAYAVSLLAHALLLAVARSHRAELRASAARLQARDAELQMLRAQIDPHFLFNSLNSISALTAVDPAGARDMTLRLAQFFRQTLTLAERERIGLADELSLLEHYLAIEQVRFGESLQSRIEVDDAARQALLPPLSLQPLVENAIKHGLRSCEGGGFIVLRALLRGGFLHIAIDNPVGTLATRGSGNGLGLRNLQQRLATLYGDRARLHWQRGETHFRVELTLPFEAAEARP
ncbi:MAG TPA: histidine kinase, partial [Arenimonas sp.]|nr:histidine kinase [Arenimonas sp.]